MSILKAAVRGAARHNLLFLSIVLQPGCGVELIQHRHQQQQQQHGPDASFPVTASAQVRATHMHRRTLQPCTQHYWLHTIRRLFLIIYQATNDRVRISQVRQRLVSSCQVSVSSCPAHAQTQEAQYAQKKYSQSCIFKAYIFTS